MRRLNRALDSQQRLRASAAIFSAVERLPEFRAARTVAVFAALPDEPATDEVLARVVASCGGKELDNRMLDFYYWQQYYTFANNYGAYLSYLMDTSKGLDEQAYSDTETWQQAFLTGAAMSVGGAVTQSVLHNPRGLS